MKHITAKSRRLALTIAFSSPVKIALPLASNIVMTPSPFALIVMVPAKWPAGFTSRKFPASTLTSKHGDVVDWCFVTRLLTGTSGGNRYPPGAATEIFF